MKIYTKTGDKGMTSLVGGQRVSKCCDRLESYGTIDELNSHLGVLVTLCEDDRDCAFLTTIQNDLFLVGGYLATESVEDVSDRKQCVVTDDMVTAIEEEIDRITALVPPFQGFVLPGGTSAASYAHVCRTVCRRAERCILRLAECGAEVDDNVIAYVNRLSDYLFILARKQNSDAEEEDVLWRK